MVTFIYFQNLTQDEISHISSNDEYVSLRLFKIDEHHAMAGRKPDLDK